MSERKSLLNAVFWFSAILAYLDFVVARSFKAYGFTVILFTLSFLCKPMSVTLPFTLALIHLLYLVYHPARRDPDSPSRAFLKDVVRPVLPLIALSFYFSAVTLSAQSIAMADAGYTFWQRLTNALLSYERYLAMFFCPRGLGIFYPLFFEDLTIRHAIPAIFVLCTLSLFALLLLRRRPQLMIGWCWFLGTMVPVIGLVQVGSQSHADRYLYIPMLGLAFLYPVLFSELRSMVASARRLFIAGTLAVLGTSMVLATQIQVSYWKDGVTLFRHSLAVTGDCFTSVENLAVAYSRAGRFAESAAYCESKIAVAKNLSHKAKLANLRASGLVNARHYEAAMESAQQALSWGNTEVSTYWVLAVSNYNLDRCDDALEYLRKARATPNPEKKGDYVQKEREDQMIVLEDLIKGKKASMKELSPPVAPDSGGRTGHK
jgi:tetratricopeptide (TPR) repeat protein